MYSYTTTLVHALALHYDTSSSIYSTTHSRVFVCVCVCVCVRARARAPEAQGTCDVLPIAQLRTTLADALIIDALIAGADFCRVTLITYPHTHTTHPHAPSRKYNCTMGK